MYWSNTTKSKCLATISVAQAKAIGVYNRRSPSSQSKEITTSPTRQIHGPIGPVNIFLSSSHIRCLHISRFTNADYSTGRWAALTGGYPSRLFATSAALRAAGSDRIDLYRRGEGYVDRILEGEKPAGLPVRAPTRQSSTSRPQRRWRCVASAFSLRLANRNRLVRWWFEAS